MTDDLCYATATELAAAIREKEIGTGEVIDAYLRRIARLNPAVNAIVTLDEAGARRRAQEADAALRRGEVWGPLHGVPVTIKDSIATAGLRTTSGSPSLRDYIPHEDATVVARLRAAGAIILGKTNLPTFAADSQTNNPVFGRTNNPWDLRRTPGGSSGGGAAAVAAGLIPLDLGSDWGGSLRAPAHFCGVFTIKPTDRRVPWTGHIPPAPGAPWGVRHIGIIGPLARSLDDVALALQIISGPDNRDMEVPPVPLGPLPSLRLEGLRLAWTDDFGVSVSRDTQNALRALARELEQRGAVVERRVPEGFDLEKAWEVWGEIRQAEAGSSQEPEVERAEAARFGVSLASEVPWLRGRAKVINATLRQYSEVLEERDALIRPLEQFLTQWEAWLCPVTLGPAFPHCETGVPVPVDGYPVPYWIATGVYLMPFNVTGSPAVVLPLARSTEGLPIGLQVVGKRWEEMKLLAVATEIARVMGPFRRPPSF
ncbi:MAG: amidase [Ardenticatenaceae bacterium]|nr:amidase [Ardenticatenaceae bacterium]HBY93811.1 amidase [Chloroflexota bacterium]